MAKEVKREEAAKAAGVTGGTAIDLAERVDILETKIAELDKLLNYINSQIMNALATMGSKPPEQWRPK